MNSIQWVKSMQIMNCLEKKDFVDCFGEDSGDWLWRKFIIDYKGEVGGFVCYLDSGNSQKIYDFIMKKIKDAA